MHINKKAMMRKTERTLVGDLDNIVLKALDREQSRRYQWNSSRRRRALGPRRRQCCWP